MRVAVAGAGAGGLGQSPQMLAALGSMGKIHVTGAAQSTTRRAVQITPHNDSCPALREALCPPCSPMLVCTCCVNVWRNIEGFRGECEVVARNAKGFRDTQRVLSCPQLQGVLKVSKHPHKRGQGLTHNMSP